uniref:Hemerythrin-like domain-containing protein n=1 Tax=Magnetococcus massalia (strain MO-1) TaxID=451514 RepID=A0A1S7LG96_MAGMO|nr:Protein of unknown function [Candidatus Magnetococcus massalia]
MSELEQAMRDPERGRAYLRSKLPTLGITELDRQHKQLLEQIINFHVLVERLLKSRPDDQDWLEIKAHFDFLLTYIRDHFSYEEGLMQRSHYAAFDAHKREHEEFTKKVTSFRRDLLEKRDIYTTVNVKFFLLEWLFSHTGTTDMKLKGEIQ